MSVSAMFAPRVLGFGAILFMVGFGVAWWVPHDRPSTAAVPESVSSTTRLLPPGVQSPLTAPTPAVRLKKLIGPWEPQRVLVVSLVPEFLESTPAMVASYVQLLRIGAQYLDVAVMVPARQPKLQAVLIRILESNEATAPLLQRIRFLPASNATFWVRDYLPQYALDPRDRLVLLDAGNVTIAHDTDASLSYFINAEADRSPDYYRRLQELLNDDVSPAFLGNHLRQTYDWPIKMVRPPLSIDGGDFVQIGDDDVILSRTTLLFNGADEDYVRDQLRDYYHVKRTHFLSTLPGNTIDHLDYIMMAAGPQTLLVASTMPSLAASKQVYAQLLNQQANEVLKQNRRILQERFPKLRLIDVPMPPVISPPRESILAEIRTAISQQLAAEAGFRWTEFTRRDAADPLKMKEGRALEALIQAKFGSVDADNDYDLDRMSRAVLGDSLDTLESLYAQNTATYRTYLNALFLHAPDGRQAVIIPRYAPRTPEEKTLFATMEPAVMAAYKSAFPKADLHWINCDPWIEYLGAVHCLTHTVPDWDTLSKR